MDPAQRTEGKRLPALLGGLSLLVLVSAAAASPPPEQAELTPAQVDAAISRGTDYLLAACAEDGRFSYRVNLRPGVEPKPKYNLLRHAGTMYALAMSHEFKANKAVPLALSRSGRFLRQQAAPLEGRPDLLAVWSRPEINFRTDAPTQAKLGATGLGLVALTHLRKLRPKEVPLDDLRGLARFLCYMQRKDGGFYSKYYPDKGRDGSWTSLYYPGEAALGLLLLYEQDPDPTWLQAAANAIGFLARSRQGRKQVEADHWALLATERLLPIYGRCQPPVPRAAVLRHAVQIIEQILRGQRSRDEHALEGEFTGDGRTTPASTRLEGLLAGLAFLPPERGDLRGRVTAAAERGLAFVVSTQVREGKFAGAIPRAARALPADHPRASVSFNLRATEVRIDYVQHALSAMVRYRERVSKQD